MSDAREPEPAQAPANREGARTELGERVVAGREPDQRPEGSAGQDETGEKAAELRRTWTDPGGLYGWFATVQNGPIVSRLVTTAFVLFLLAGLQALLMRTQLARPLNNFISADRYNELFTMHGSTMMFLVTVPIMEGLAAFALPLLLGARELPFPRMTAFGFWTFFFGAVLFYSSFLFNAVPDAGWYAYVPLSGPIYSPGPALDFWLLGLSVAEVAAIATGIELIIGILKMRAPGMTLVRMPIYLWAILVMAYSLLFGFTPLIVGTALLELDRKIGMRFFDPAGGGDPLLWQHIFWIFGHPDVYVQFIPGTGIISLVVATFARRPLVGYTLIAASILATGMISFGLWVHHMYTVGLPVLGLTFFALASMTIAIPSGIQVFAWLATIWTGRPVLRTPMLFALGFVFIFVLGGLTGVMVAIVPFDWQVHDTYFLVAHFHYVLIGGVIFPIFAALYYWLPKMSGRMLSEGLGRWVCGLMFAGFNLAFFPMHVSGLLGMPRRYATYPPGVGLETPNLLSTIGAYVLGVGIALFVADVIWRIFLQKGEPAPDDPWGAGTLDFATPTPPPNEGYQRIPIVRSLYPLWQQDDLASGPARYREIAEGMAHTPSRWRAQLLTGALDAEPQAIVRLSGPSLRQVLVAGVMGLNFVAPIFDLNWLLLLSFVGVVAAAIYWLWPSKEERDLPEVDAEGRVHGLPAYTSGTSAIGWWSMVHVLLVIGVALATLVFSYFYLRTNAPAWPPNGQPEPGLLYPLLNLGVVAAGAGLALIAERGIRQGRRTPLLLGAGGSVLLGLVFLALLVVELSTAGFGPQASAYASAYFVLAGFQGVLVAGGVVISAVVLAQGWLGYFNRLRFLAVQNAALYWGGTLVSWLVLFAVLYLSPRLI